jgi:hypothetical protein
MDGKIGNAIDLMNERRDVLVKALGLELDAKTLEVDWDDKAALFEGTGVDVEEAKAFAALALSMFERTIDERVNPRVAFLTVATDALLVGLLVDGDEEVAL